MIYNSLVTNSLACYEYEIIQIVACNKFSRFFQEIFHTLTSHFHKTSFQKILSIV
jgi:hypothetical protein